MTAPLRAEMDAAEYESTRTPVAAESLVAAYRREVLNAELFHSLLETHVLSERWRRI